MGGDMVFEAIQLRAEQARSWSVTTNFYSWLYYATFPLCAAIYAVRKWYGENWTKWLIIRKFIDDLEELVIENFRKILLWKLNALIVLSAYMLIQLLLSR